jgi:hypothetical protein
VLVYPPRASPPPSQSDTQEAAEVLAYAPPMDVSTTGSSSVDASPKLSRLAKII